MKYTRIKDILARPTIDQNLILAKGWLKTARHGKELSFLNLNDGSCMSGIQVIAEPNLPNYKTEIIKLDTGCAIAVEGLLVASPGAKQKYEIKAQKIEVIGGVPEDYPLQKKRHSFEFLRTIAHLRPRTNTIGAMLRVRNAAARAIHQFFQENGFFYIHTPIITASDCEGAGQMFRVSVLDAKNPPLKPDGNPDFAQDFFARQSFLTVSGQLEAEAMALALGNVYTFGPTFRAENSNTPRHAAEFWMIEPEVAFCDLEGDMDLAEQFLKSITRHVATTCEEDIAFFGEQIDKNIQQTIDTILNETFARITYTEAVDILIKSGKQFEYPVQWGIDLQSEHERFLTEQHFKKAVIVTNYPKKIKSFYMYLNDDTNIPEDRQTVRAMDILVPRVGEVIGGSQREHRYDVLKQRMESLKMNLEPYWWYLDLRRYGSVPHAGFGMGFERFLMFITGITNIREVLPFPRVPGYAEF